MLLQFLTTMRGIMSALSYTKRFKKLAKHHARIYLVHQNCLLTLCNVNNYAGSEIYKNYLSIIWLAKYNTLEHV